MKIINTFLLSLSLLIARTVFAQDTLPAVYLPADLTIHFISPEPIQYVDISSKLLTGDLPLKNVLRIRLKDSAAFFKDAVVTIAGEKYIAQYHILPGTGKETEINIMPGDTRPLDISGIGFSQNQLKTMSLALAAMSPGKKLEKVSAFGLTGKLNHVYTAGDYLFLDISYRNKTRLKYDIEDFQFTVDDKKVTKASNVQSVELKPEFILYSVPSFGKYYRNIFVFKKLTFPGNKVLLAELSEKQISGRVLTLKISYRDILNADTLPN
jgi:conjugative transposon TraN protein